MFDFLHKDNIRKPKEKRLSRFWRIVIIYALSLVLVFSVLLCVLAAFLRTYEMNLPEKTAEEFAESFKERELISLAEEMLGEISEFETPALIIERSEFLHGEIKYLRFAKEYTSEKPVYRIICGENDIGKLILKKADTEASFGLTRWEKESAELYTEAISGAKDRISVKIIVPDGAALKINGKIASQEYISEENGEYGGRVLTIGYEGGFDTYVIENLCTLPEIEAEYNGETAMLAASDGVADWFDSSQDSFVLTVPSNADVLINGSAPSRELAVKGSITEAVNEFEKELGDKLPGTVSYFAYGKENAEKCISVSVGGEILEGSLHVGDDGVEKLVYLNTEASRYSVRALVPEGAELYVNGVKASDSYIKGSEVFSLFDNLTYLVKNKDTVSGVLYEVSGLLCVPEISAMIEGEELPVCYEKREKQTFTAEFYGMDDSTCAAVQKSSDGFARAYFHYVSNGAVGIEENYNTLIARMLLSSPGYKHIKQSKSSYEFVNQCVYKINHIEPVCTVSLGEGMYFCRLDFSVHLRFYRNEKQYEGTLSLVLKEEDGVLLVCEMTIEENG